MPSTLDTFFPIIAQSHKENLDKFYKLSKATRTDSDVDRGGLLKVGGDRFTYGVDAPGVKPHLNYFNNTQGYTTIMGERIPMPAFSKQPMFENFLGTGPAHERIPIKKQAVNNFSRPNEGIFKGYGVANTDAIREKIITTVRKNDARLFDPEMVPPGMGLGAANNSQRSLQPMVRVLPKNVDALRPQTRQKKTFNNQIVPGQIGKGTRPNLGKMEVRNAPTFIVDRPLEKGRAQNTKQKADENYDLVPTKRAQSRNLMNITGIYSAAQTLVKNIGFFTEQPKKSQLPTGGPTIASASVKRQQAYDPNDQARPTQREFMNKMATGAKSAVPRQRAENLADIPRYTGRQTLSEATVPGLVTGAGGRGHKYDPNDLLKPTVRETTEATNMQLLGAAAPFFGKGPSVDFNDTPKATVRDTTGSNPHEAFVSGYGGQKGIYYDPNDRPNATIRDTTGEVSRLHTGAQGRVPHGHKYDPHDAPGATIRDTTGVNSHDAFVSGYGGQKGIYYDPNDRPDATIRDTTGESSRFQTGAQGRVAHGHKYDPTDRPDATIRDTTGESSRFQSGAQGRVSHGHKYDPNDTPGPTQRSIMLEGEFNLTAGKNAKLVEGGLGGYITKNDEPRDTSKELSQKLYMGNPQRADTYGGYITVPKDLRETQRVSYSANAPLSGGGSAQYKKDYVFDKANVHYHGARDDAFRKMDPRTPTPFHGSEGPQIKTTGSLRVDKRDLMYADREVYPQPGYGYHVGCVETMKAQSTKK